MSGIIGQSSQPISNNGPAIGDITPLMQAVMRLDYLLLEKDSNSKLVKDVCSGLTGAQIADCLIRHVSSVGIRARGSMARELTEGALLGSPEDLAFENLFSICKVYRLGGLRREMSAFVEQAFALNKINLSGTDRTLKLMRELALDGTIEHELFDQLIAIERTKIFKKSDEAKVEFLRSIGLCHSNHREDFKLVLEDITPRLPELSARNMTRLLMGWSQVEYSNAEALHYALEHVASLDINYTARERAISLKCLAIIASEKEVHQVWDKIAHTFTRQVLNKIIVCYDLLQAISAVGLPIDQDRLQLIKTNVTFKSTEWIEQDVFNQVRFITQHIGENHSARQRVATEMAEKTLDHAGTSYAIIVDYPWEHRLGGFDDAPLCGNEKIREMILRRAGYTVIRIPERLLFSVDTKYKLEQFIQSKPQPDSYIMTANN